MRRPRMTERDSPQIEALVQRAAAGDRDAVAELLTGHLDELQAFVRGRMGAQLLRRESSADIVQSICREVLEKSDRFQFPEEHAFRRWLYAMAERKLGHRYEYYAAARRATGKEATLPSSVQLGALGIDAGGSTPSRQVMAREEMARVEAAFRALPAHYRDVIVQARVLGKSREEMARAAGKNPAAIGNLLFRALAALAEQLEGEARPGA